METVTIIIPVDVARTARTKARANVGSVPPRKVMASKKDKARRRHPKHKGQPLD